MRLKVKSMRWQMSHEEWKYCCKPTFFAKTGYCCAVLQGIIKDKYAEDKRFVKVRRTDVVHMWKHRYVFFYLQRIAIQLSCDMLYFGADKTAEDPQEG